MSFEWAFIPNDEWMVCDICGGKFRSTYMRKRWDNLWACPADFELRHQQDFVRARTDKVVKDNPKPRPTDTFINPLCTTNSSMPGVAVPGCAIPGMSGPSTVDAPLPPTPFSGFSNGFDEGFS